MKIISDYFTLCPRQVWYNRGMRNFMNKKELLKKIKQDKKIILISTNIIEDIESYSDFIYTIENGRLKEYEK